MDFKEFYREFEADVKEELSAALWDKARVKADPEGFAKELFDSDIGFTAEEAAEEFVDMIHVMKDQGEFNEATSAEALDDSIIDEIASAAAGLPKGDWRSYEKVKKVILPKYRDTLPVDMLSDAIAAAVGV